jgi:molybdopterin synthase catalytic subunit
VKTRVPIWKRELLEGGASRWLENEPTPGVT